MRTLYQAVRDTGDPDKIESNGPIKCTNNSAWLGHGYYFWDSFVELAHHWGKTHYKGCYMVCSATSELAEADVYDLIDNPEHIREFRDICKGLMSIYGIEITVPFAIEYLKSENDYTYKAIRACGINSFGNSVAQKIVFEQGHRAFMEMFPAWQICVTDKNILTSGSYKVIYPQEYAIGYVI